MPIQTFSHNLRLVIAGILCLLLVLTYSDFDTPTSIYNRFVSAIVASIALVVLFPVIFRGKDWQTMLGLALAILPGIMLGGAVQYILMKGR